MESMRYTHGDFCKYINTFRVEKGSDFTHTSIVKPSGAFYVPVEEEDNFFRLYKAAMRVGDDLHMTEKHKYIGPIVIDLDFRFDINDTNIKRQITAQHIHDIVSVYTHAIREYIDMASVESFNMYVMQKPYIVIDKGVVKDGLHIVVPDIITKPTVQYLIRKNVLKKISEIFASLDLKNGIEDIIDEAVIERNNWQMYGSCKPNCDTYKVISQYTCDNQSFKEEPLSQDRQDEEYVELLSIRNKYYETKIKDEKIEEVNAFEETLKKAKKAKMNGPAFQTNQNLKKNTVDNIEFVQKVVDLLDKKRADSYQEWIRVGWCLRNIDYRLLGSWIEFSKKSSKYNEGECERIWSYMRDDGLGVGTLYMWAKQDNNDGFNELRKNDLSELILQSINETHNDIAKVVYFMYKYEFVCSSIQRNFWYEYKNHRWVSSDSGYGLRMKISSEVVREYIAARASFEIKAAQTEVESERQYFQEKAKKLNAIITKLKLCPFKDNIIKECREMFYIEKFEERLDSKCHLIGFTNGVYDLQANEFREGRPDDYISLTCGVNYLPYDVSHPCQRDIERFLNQIFTKSHIKEYVLLLLASFLNGSIREERFHIWTGSGSNGKSKLIDLFEQSFGEYCCKFPVTLLTQKRAASNAATSELARSKGKRFACLQEPAEDEKLNIGLMKELTGGDKIQARLIYKEPIEFKPQFKMILTCNHLPNVPSDDGGTWRRIRVVEFTSKFTENPNPDNPNEFMVDLELSHKFEDWKDHFMSLIIEYYKKYMETGIVEPEEVLKCTKDYQKNNDFILEFIETELEKYEPGFVTITDILALFKTWAKESLPNMKTFKKKDILVGLDKTLGAHVYVNRVEGWKGWRFKQTFVDDDNDGIE